MADRHFSRDAGRLTHRLCTLQPARSLLFRVTLWASICVPCAAAGAAAHILWQAHRAGLPPQPCTSLSVDDNTTQTELSRARLALQQEQAARAAVQKAADGAAAEAARLDAELKFLRGQDKGPPSAAAEKTRR